MTAVTELTRRPTVTADPARFRDLLAAEWIKLWSLRSTRWTLPLVFLFVIGVSVNSSLADHRNWPTYPEERREMFRLYGPVRDAFPEAGYLLLILASATLGALTIVGEYQSGLIRATFAAVPARRAMVAAKAVVLAGVMLVFGTLTAATAFWASQAILADRGAGWSIGEPGCCAPLWRAPCWCPCARWSGWAWARSPGTPPRPCSRPPRCSCSYRWWSTATSTGGSPSCTTPCPSPPGCD